MGIVEEECDETGYWIEVLLQEEANEILAVTVSSIKTARKRQQI
jgi:hypothetical protein